jgi:hypothetical protein
MNAKKGWSRYMYCFLISSIAQNGCKEKLVLTFLPVTALRVPLEDFNLCGACCFPFDFYMPPAVVDF